MDSSQAVATVPESLQGLLASPDRLAQLEATKREFINRLRKDPSVLRSYAKAPMDTFLAGAPADLRAVFTDEHRRRLDEILLSDAQSKLMLTNAQAQPTDLLGSSWGSTWCQIGTWAAIVAAVGGAIAISQGALVAPLIAASEGILLPVLAAITGLTEGTISTLAVGAGFTLGVLIQTACDQAFPG
jgi:hypothetical protein